MKKLLFFTMILIAVTAYAQDGVVINGVLWAERNVGMPGKFTTNVEDAGMFYQFNRRVGWDEAGPSQKDVVWNEDEYGVDKWDSHNDPCPKGWRVPYLEELVSLSNPVKVETRMVKNGRHFTDKASGASIFLPTASFYWGHEDGKPLIRSGYGGYWSSRASGSERAYIMRIHRNSVRPADSAQSYEAYSIRCVAADPTGSVREKRFAPPASHPL